MDPGLRRGDGMAWERRDPQAPSPTPKPFILSVVEGP
jgi:hypothetical protein